MTETDNKSIAIINAKAPYSQCSGKDALDIALIFGSYEQSVSLFFQGDGVWQLISGQNGALISVKDYLKTFAAFEFYDIEDIYLCETSLTDRGLPLDFHIENVHVLNQADFTEKLIQHQTILRL